MKIILFVPVCSLYGSCDSSVLTYNEDTYILYKEQEVIEWYEKNVLHARAHLIAVALEKPGFVRCAGKISLHIHLSEQSLITN